MGSQSLSRLRIHRGMPEAVREPQNSEEDIHGAWGGVGAQVKGGVIHMGKLFTLACSRNSNEQFKCG